MIDVQRFILALRSYDGVPWHLGGRTRAGLDCIGLVIAALRDIGVEPNRDMVGYSLRIGSEVLEREFVASGLVEKVPSEPRAGDVMLMRVMNDPIHVAVYLGESEMIHASFNVGVRIVHFSPLWRDRLVSVWRWR